MVSVNGVPTKPRASDAPRAALHRKALRAVRREEPENVADLVERVEADYQFKLAYLTLQALIQSAPVTIEVDGDDRAARLADNLTTIWKETLPYALRAIAFGRAAFERTYRIDPATGLALVAGLDYLPFEHTALRLDADGSFDGIELAVDERATILDPSRSWWFALDPTALAPHGRSRYLGAALEVWKARRRLEKQEEIWFSKFAIGHGVARAPERSETDPVYDKGSIGDLDAAGELLDPMDVLRQRCEEIESGGVLVLSSKAYPDGKYLYDYEQTVGQKESGPLEDRRVLLDAAALRSLGIPERALTQDGSAGSYALAQAHLTVLHNTCEGILAQLAASFQKYVIGKSIALNWPADCSPALTLVHQPIGDRRRDLVVALVKDLLSSSSLSPLLATGAVDVVKLLEIANLPIGSNAAARLADLYRQNEPPSDRAEPSSVESDALADARRPDRVVPPTA